MSDIRDKLCGIMKKMFEGENAVGIYPTGVAYDELEKLVKEKQTEAIGWTYAFACNCLDKGIDLRNESVPNILDGWLKANQEKP